MKKNKPIDKEKVLELIKNGTNTCQQIANILGYNCSSIFAFCKRNNIQLKKYERIAPNIVDMTNMIINGIKIIKRVQNVRGKLAAWECICPCGKTFVSTGADIRNNRVKSCGCRTSIKTKRNWQGYDNIPKLYWSSINHRAENGKWEFSITIEYINQLWILQNGKCALSGLPLSLKKRAVTGSLDRIDSSKGYIEGNVQWVHKDINFMKQDLSQEKFYEYCKLITKNLEGKYENSSRFNQ